MKKLVIGEAPEAFDARFLDWLRHWEDRLSVRLADWVPSSSGKVRCYADTVRQVVPADLQFYYEHAYPFGLLRDGWNRWTARIERYHIAWVRSMVDRLAMESTHAEALVAASPPLWPIYCLEQKRDVAGFVWQDRIDQHGSEWGMRLRLIQDLTGEIKDLSEMKKPGYPIYSIQRTMQSVRDRDLQRLE